LDFFFRGSPSVCKARQMIIRLPETPSFCLERHERGVGGLLDEFAEPLQGLVVEGRLDPATVGPGLEGAGLTAELEQLGNGRGVDGEPGGEFPSRALAFVDGIEDTLAEIIRQGLHESPPIEVQSSNRVPNGRAPL